MKYIAFTVFQMWNYHIIKWNRRYFNLGLFSPVKKELVDSRVAV